MALSVLTWNVWFGGHRFDERVPALLDRIERADADLIGLQEVTPEFFDALIKRFGRTHTIFDEKIGTYGALILTRLPVRRGARLPLPTRMGRDVPIIEIEGGVTFATVHLESLDEPKTRVAQLDIIFRFLKGDQPVIFAGDMNFADDAPLETEAIDPGFADVWKAVRPDEPGFTVDTEVNRMKATVKEKRTQKRIDRIFARGLAPQAIRLVGDDPAGDPELFASDHFGLLATFGTPVDNPPGTSDIRG